MKIHKGGCHCGRIRFEVTGDLGEVLACNCSICTKKGLLHLIVDHTRFRALIEDDAVATYTFGTGVARHMFCRVCGVTAYYVPRSDLDKIDVNARCIDGVDLSVVKIKPFDGRNWEAAAAERKAATA